MKKILINEIAYLVGDRFKDFTFQKKSSSNVNVFGYDHNGYFVIQFNNGGTYLYDNVPTETIQGAIECESIGKYYRAEISSKHTGIKMIKPAVVLDNEISELD